MNRLLQIEWLKLRHFRPFWILTGLYALVIMLICGSAMYFLEWLKQEGADFRGIDPTILPIYDFPDVWHNIAFIAAYFKFFLGFIVIITIANEARNRTVRQNVIDGLSNWEFLSSKLILLMVLALLATLLVFLIGLIAGNIYAHEDSFRYLFHGMDFLFANFLSVFTYLTFAMLLTLILPRAGIIIVGLLMYTIFFEPIFSLAVTEHPHTSDTFKFIVSILPITSLNNLIHIPFPRYFLAEIQDYVSAKEAFIAICWLAFNIGMSYWVLQKKDW